MWTMARVPVQTSKAGKGKKAPTKMSGSSSSVPQSSASQSSENVPTKEASKSTHSLSSPAQQVQLDQPAQSCSTRSTNQPAQCSSSNAAGPTQSMSEQSLARVPVQTPKPVTGKRKKAPTKVSGSSSTNQPAQCSSSDAAQTTRKMQSQTPNERKLEFEQLQQKLAHASSWDAFWSICRATALLDKYLISLQALDIDLFKKDRSAMLLYPSDAPRFTPIHVYGDGNCLPRCASILAFGDEDQFTEMRVRIAIEMALHRDIYSNPNMSSVVANLPKKALLYSEHFVGQHLTDGVLDKMFEDEVMGSVKNSQYMGILQVYAMATLFQMSLPSIYPENVGHNVRADCHHLVHPVRGNTSAEESDVGIMFTHTKGWHGLPAEWQPNHFVVCIPPGLGPTLFAGDFVLARVYHAKGSERPELYVAELTTSEMSDHGLKGAWGVYLVPCNGGKSWKRPDSDRSPLFLLAADITEVLEHYNFEDDGRTLRYNFPNVMLQEKKKSST
ncbi:uncharacterized protein [Littorina saxatilis]|uniref:uncharacterized protein n=1 Tax=Littorina saxatilis TaxID=31220 RepID=UPI0038B5C432